MLGAAAGVLFVGKILVTSVMFCWSDFFIYYFIFVGDLLKTEGVFAQRAVTSLREPLCVLSCWPCLGYTLSAPSHKKFILKILTSGC